MYSPLSVHALNLTIGDNFVLVGIKEVDRKLLQLWTYVGV